MRFEVLAAFTLGILIPLLETLRRGIGYWAIEFTTMFEDYAAGGLLLIAGWAAHRRLSWGDTFLVLAWGYLTGLLSSSFWSQLEETLRGSASDLHNLEVVVVKFFLWSVCVVSAVLSFKRALSAREAQGPRLSSPQ